MRPRRVLLAGLGALGALALGACGLSDPFERSPSGPTPTGAEHDRRTDAPGARVSGDPAPPAVRAIGARRVVESFALQWANWTPRTTRRQYLRLAALATPRLAAVYRRSAQVRVRGAAGAGGSSARVVAVDIRGRGPARRVVCVTAERPISGAHAAAVVTYHVYFGRLRKLAGRWAIDDWSQQS